MNRTTGPLTLRVALRYLFAPKSHSAVNVISFISVAGVAVATLAIVCVLSVFNGFTEVASSRLSVLDPALRVSPASGKQIADADSLLSLITRTMSPDVTGVSAVVEERALAVYGDRQMSVRIRGVDSLYASHTPVEAALIDGEFFAGHDLHGHHLATLGVGVAINLGAHPGYYDWLNLYVPRRTGRINPANPMAAFRGDSLVVSGVFQINQAEYDNDLIIVPIDVAQRLLDMPGQATSLHIALRPGVDVNSLGKRLAATLGKGFSVETRMQQQAVTYRMIEVEKWVTMLLLIFILVIASFNIISTLSMLIIEKRGDISILRSLGATRRFVGSIFLNQGFMITLFGGIIGIVGGVILCLIQQRFGLIRLGGDPSQLSITVYPVRLEWTDLLIVGAVTVGVGLGVGAVARLTATSGMRGARRLGIWCLIVGATVLPSEAKTPICGESQIDAETLCHFVRQHNSDFPIEIARAYIDVCARYGIRADIAFCQAIIETGWFKFGGGTAMNMEDHNFCGLGVTRLGIRGAEFATIEEGVTAQIQHLYAYACQHRIPEGERLLDPRFALVRRGCAPHWEDLSGRWAANANYARDILSLHSRLMAFVPVTATGTVTPAESAPDRQMPEREEPELTPDFFD